MWDQYMYDDEQLDLEGKGRPEDVEVMDNDDAVVKAKNIHSRYIKGMSPSSSSQSLNSKKKWNLKSIGSTAAFMVLMLLGVSTIYNKHFAHESPTAQDHVVRIDAFTGKLSEVNPKVNEKATTGTKRAPTTMSKFISDANDGYKTKRISNEYKWEHDVTDVRVQRSLAAVEPNEGHLERRMKSSKSDSGSSSSKSKSKSRTPGTNAPKSTKAPKSSSSSSSSGKSSKSDKSSKSSKASSKSSDDFGIGGGGPENLDEPDNLDEPADPTPAPAPTPAPTPNPTDAPDTTTTTETNANARTFSLTSTNGEVLPTAFNPGTQNTVEKMVHSSSSPGVTYQTPTTDAP
mmetsp:Transcript_53994/g.131099  ORF Transcript_53994/g.131099 Transcript_53994/m.131099 type:complete len:344 (+) Transcript_53994:132-1163(+)